MKKHVSIALLALFLAIPASATDVLKKGYIITMAGDTVRGIVILRKELGMLSSLSLFAQVKFADSTGTRKTYKPQDLKGYGLTWINDSTMTHFLSFIDVEMQASFGTKKETAFFMRQVTGYVEVYYLFHTIIGPYTRYDIPELYLRETSDTSDNSSLIRLKPKLLKAPTRYRRSDVLPYLKDWPQDEYNKIHEELSPMELMECVATYNEWRKTSFVSKQ